jgi:hypothetical protein
MSSMKRPRRSRRITMIFCRAQSPGAASASLGARWRAATGMMRAPPHAMSGCLDRRNGIEQ